jgi:hypothetical protein
MKPDVSEMSDATQRPPIKSTGPAARQTYNRRLQNLVQRYAVTLLE